MQEESVSGGVFGWTDHEITIAIILVYTWSYNKKRKVELSNRIDPVASSDVPCAVQIREGTGFKKVKKVKRYRKNE